jgi:aminoglycoside phosphotransferase (APT) family kinase protein
VLGGGHPLHTERPDGPLVDRALDGWEEAMAAEGGTLPIHGDFYGGNLIVADGRVAGVIDWSDAHLAHPEQEVAWATWEFCQNEAGDDLVDEQAEAFLQAYVASGGRARVAAPFDPMPWIRRRLRWEARAWFADPR